MCAGVHACACVRACVCAFTYRQKDDLVHKLHYDAVNKLNHIIYLSFRFSLYLPIYIRTHARTHIHTCVCVCVIGCSHPYYGAPFVTCTLLLT